jgi:hypothetical protein
LAVLASELHTEVSSNVAYLWLYLEASIVFVASLGFLSIALKRLNSN